MLSKDCQKITMGVNHNKYQQHQIDLCIAVTKKSSAWDAWE